MQIHLTDFETDIRLEILDPDEALNWERGSKAVSLDVQNEDWGYRGRCEFKVDSAEWTNFLSALRSLNESLAGSAAFSGDGATVEFVALDNLGALGVKGVVTIGNFTLQFEPVKFDSTEFDRIVQKFEAA